MDNENNGGMPTVGWLTTGDVWTVCADCAPTREAARMAWGTAADDDGVPMAAVPLDQAVLKDFVCRVCGRRLDRPPADT